MRRGSDTTGVGTNSFWNIKKFEQTFGSAYIKSRRTGQLTWSFFCIGLLAEGGSSVQFPICCIANNYKGGGSVHGFYNSTGLFIVRGQPARPLSFRIQQLGILHFCPTILMQQSVNGLAFRQKLLIESKVTSYQIIHAIHHNPVHHKPWDVIFHVLLFLTTGHFKNWESATLGWVRDNLEWSISGDLHWLNNPVWEIVFSVGSSGNTHSISLTWGDFYILIFKNISQNIHNEFLIIDTHQQLKQCGFTYCPLNFWHMWKDTRNLPNKLNPHGANTGSLLHKSKRRLIVNDNINNLNCPYKSRIMWGHRYVNRKIFSIQTALRGAIVQKFEEFCRKQPPPPALSP